MVWLSIRCFFSSSISSSEPAESRVSGDAETGGVGQVVDLAGEAVALDVAVGAGLDAGLGVAIRSPARLLDF